MVGLSRIELECMAENMANSCRDISKKVEKDNDGKDLFTFLECDLYDLFCYKLISIFGNDALE